MCAVGNNTLKQVKIIGTGSFTPQNNITNDDLTKLVDTSDEWIVTRTGIKERRISKGQDTSFFASLAAKAAIENAKIDSLEIDLIIVATCTPDSFMPSTACIVQKEIGAKNATCFDVSAACSGFIYALDTAHQFLRSGSKKTALVIGSEVMSKTLDWTDRSTCVLFGDGAGAVIVKATDKTGIISVYTGSDGTGSELLECQAMPVINPFTSPEENKIKPPHLSMNGQGVFKFAVRILMECIEKLLEDSQIDLSEVKYIIPHQANYRIIDFAAKKLGVSVDKFYMNLDKYGNTSAASIPIALDEMMNSGLINGGDKLIFIGFGGGLTWGSILIEM